MLKLKLTVTHIRQDQVVDKIMVIRAVTRRLLEKGEDQKKGLV